jgi:hypothetical protein
MVDLEKYKEELQSHGNSAQASPDKPSLDEKLKQENANQMSDEKQHNQIQQKSI